MTENEPAERIRATDTLAAAALLTRLPLPPLSDETARRGARATWVFPLIGAVLGLIVSLVLATCLAIGLSSQLAAALALGASILLTGALHEDGLADCADGFWGGTNRDKRLEIMKDSRSGAYGILAICLSLMIRWSALTALAAQSTPWGALIFAGAVSRSLIVCVWAGLPPSRPGGLSASQGRPAPRLAAVALALALIVALLCLPFGTAVAGSTAALAAGLGAAYLAHRKIGGQTGDVLGATQQCVEMAVLVALSALIPRT